MAVVHKALEPVTTDIDAAQLRTRVLLGLGRIALLILTAVIVFRIAVPYLFNLHTDLGLAGAAVVGLFGLVALIWLAFDLTTFLRRIRRSGSQTSVRPFGRP
jgi:hypothetical protein